MSTQLANWHPFQELNELQNRLSTLFGRRSSSELAESGWTADWAPAVDIAEDDQEFLITADLPDVKKEDVKVTCEDGLLTISGERKHESEEKDKKKKYHRIERSYGSYTRSFRVPSEVDQKAVKARFDNGVLKVHLPKVEECKPSSQTIPVD